MTGHPPAPPSPFVYRFQRLLFATSAAVGLLLGLQGAAHACVGTACMQIWSTADGGGALAVQWDFSQQVQTALELCLGAICFPNYSTSDPEFMAPPEDVPGDSYYPLGGRHRRDRRFLRSFPSTVPRTPGCS